MEKNTALSTNVKEEIRFCKDIDMFTIDRPRTTCKHATRFCRETCFNIKLEKAFPVIHQKDVRNELYWQELTGEQLNATLSRKRNQTRRIRLMSRGESFSTDQDIDKVIDLLNGNKQSLFWIPTRAWRKPALRDRIEQEVMTLKNARVQASLDPSNTDQEKEEIINRGWSTMFYGNDQETNGRKLCPKTWQHKVGHCSKCKGGCFAAKQTHIHLKQH